MDVILRAHGAMACGDFATALKLWQKAADQEPAAFWPRYWMADALIRTGARRHGRAELEVLTCDDMGIWQLPVRLAELALDDGDLDKALIWFRRACQFPDIEAMQRMRLASRIINLTLGGSGFPPSVFDLDIDLLSEMPV